MKKEEYIQKNGLAAWEARLARNRRMQKRNRIDKALAVQDEFQKLDPSEQQEFLRDMWKKREGHYSRSGLPQNIVAARNTIRHVHRSKWGVEGLDVHHDWVGDTAEYTGVALVEREEHQRGIINVVAILDGEIANFKRG